MSGGLAELGRASRAGVAAGPGRDYTAGMEDHRTARFVEADFTGTRCPGVILRNVTISDAWLIDVDLEGHGG